jgi:phosphatidylserine/phosphatidylglycerophosphate/cardiolipin synthase-like enzyme
MNEFDEWLKEEANPLSQNVAYLHTKFLVADPLGDDPWVVTGSANFSEASTTKNDENMVVVRGNTRLCDIYLGEFMRTFSHYSFRDWAASVPKSQWHDISWLAETDAWVDDFFTRGKRKTLEREYFGP